MIIGHIGGGSSVDTGDIGKSVRLRANASANISRAFPSAMPSSWTLAFWMKRENIGTAHAMYMLSGASGGLRFNADGTVSLINTAGSAFATTTAVLRDPSAWYLFIWRYTGTAYQLEVNGQQVLSITTTQIGWGAGTHLIGGAPSNNYFDGYLSRVCFVAGASLDYTSFSYLNADTNALVPKTQAQCKAVVDAGGSLSYMLDFDNGTSLTTLGNDKSAKGNNWTLNNISLTAGTTYDWMEDTPTNVFPTLNPLDTKSGVTLQGASLDLYTPTNATSNTRATMGMSNGKWYWEVYIGSGAAAMHGICRDSANLNSPPGTDANGWGYLQGTGQKYTNGSGSAFGATYTSADIIGVAYDADIGELSFYKNGVSQGVAFSGLTGTMFPSGGTTSAAGQITASYNFGQRPFAYTPPNGFKALCTKNLPTPAILNPENHFDVLLHSNPTSLVSQDVVGTLFQPDMIWVKGRNFNGHNAVFDSVRGANQGIYPSLTSAEATWSGQAFLSNGFRVDRTYSGETNTGNGTFVDWLWKAGGAAVTNTAGSITSQVSANPTAGFSIVTYTGTGANATVGHGLGVAPKMVVVKARGAATNSYWRVRHESLAANLNLVLNTTDAQYNAVTVSSGGGVLNLNSSTFGLVAGVSNADYVNQNTIPYVAYCFAEIPGFSRIGSYTGNGSADGPFVWCGFRPKYLLFKRVDAAGYSWGIYDAARDTVNDGNNLLLMSDSTAAESTATARIFDFVSNGFKARGTDAGSNASGGTYIFMAFAETPFKYANAR